MANGGGTSWTVQVYVVTRGVKIGKWLASWVREYMATPHRPEKPPDRPSNQPSPTEPDGDQAPDTPPTEPEPIPVEEPPNAPGKRGPYVVHSNLSSGAISGVGDPHEVRIVGHRSVIPVRQGNRSIHFCASVRNARQ